MKKLFFILLFLPLFANSQQLKVRSQKAIVTNPFSSTYNAISGTYFNQVGDSINLTTVGSSFQGVSFWYKKQRKDVCKLYLSVNLKRLGATTTRFYYGFILWKNGARVTFTDNDFYATSLNFARFQSIDYKTIGVKNHVGTINFSKLPQYDSLQVHVSVGFYGTVGGTGAYATFNVNNFYLEPIENKSGVTRYNASIGSEFDWNPFLQMDDTTYITQGTSIQIFNNNVSYIPLTDTAKVIFDWVSDIGIETDTSLNIKATTLGNYNATLSITDSRGYMLDYHSTVIKVEPKKAIGSKTILAIGDSHLGSWNYQRQLIDDSLNITLTSIGTQAYAPYKNEGYGGWVYSNFNGSSSPFYIGGKIDFNAYLTNNSFATPDIIYITCGVNDIFSNPFQSSITSAIVNSQKLVDSILSQLPNVKIIISLKPTLNNTYAPWDASFPTLGHTYFENYLQAVRSLNNQIYSKYNSGNYNSRVTTSYDTYVIDRNNGFPIDNASHPATLGYKQLAKGIMNIINHINQ